MAAGEAFGELVALAKGRGEDDCLGMMIDFLLEVFVVVEDEVADERNVGFMGKVNKKPRDPPP